MIENRTLRTTSKISDAESADGGLSLPAMAETDRFGIVSWLLMGSLLILALKLKLLMALLAGMLVFELVQLLTDLLRLGNLRGYRARMTAVALLATLTVALLSLGLSAPWFSCAGEPRVSPCSSRRWPRLSKVPAVFCRRSWSGVCPRTSRN